MKNRRSEDHTFVLLAFGESEFLPECLASLEAQTVSSKIMIATATDNAYIRTIAQEHGLEVSVIENHTGMAGDFDFAHQVADTKYVTIAHQDDTYCPTYLEAILDAVDDDTVIAFTDYFERHTDGDQTANLNLKIKRVLLAPLRLKCLQSSVWVRRRVLSLGNPICCPSVTFHRGRVPEVLFAGDFRSNMDWAAWERLSRKKGNFVYIPQMLMMHRIHSESTTTECIHENVRTKEDYQMFRLFWPDWIAFVLTKMYAYSEKSNG